LDREYLVKQRLESDTLSFGGLRLLLQKAFVAAFLYGDQVGNLDRIPDFAKTANGL
jgi:hypothetical protein